MTLAYSTDIYEILLIANDKIHELKDRNIDVVDVAKPPDFEYAHHLSLVVSKLSPLIGNMIEFAIVSELNRNDWSRYNGKWDRQDPGFPDTIFRWDKAIKPGIEVKTWFPFATEITARFRDSQLHFANDQTHVAIVAWMPEHLIYGRPRIMDIFIDTAKSLAVARDTHYHNPPDYLVFEPENTTGRTSNLQQTNTNGYKFQGSERDLKKAEAEVASWGRNAKRYSVSPAYQRKLKSLLGRHSYRLDTNFAKMDRIEHPGLEEFKTRVLQSEFYGATVEEWGKGLIRSEEGLNRLMNL
ncbi:MAG: hypothetical protein AB1846_02610 [Chloroflexota bacterium]